MPNSLVAQFVSAMHAGKVCLHPTDTLPGLTAWPEHKDFANIIPTVKGQRGEKNFVSLAPDMETALKYWQPLPGAWISTLSQLWPGPLTVIWKGNEHTPTQLLAHDGSIAIRVPHLNPGHAWLYDVMFEIGTLLPSTSANSTGQPPSTDWKSARDFLEPFADSFVPQVGITEVSSGSPSTLIRLLNDGEFEVLREGAVTLAEIEAARLTHV